MGAGFYTYYIHARDYVIISYLSRDSMSTTQLMKFLLHTESRLQSPDVPSLLERLASETTPSYSTQRASRATDRWEWPGDEASYYYALRKGVWLPVCPLCRSKNYTGV